MRIKTAIAAIGILLASSAGVAQATSPQQTIAKLRAQVAAVTKQRDAARKTLANDKHAFALELGIASTAKIDLAKASAALTAMTTDRNTQAANLTVANAALASAQSSLTSAQGTVSSLQAAIGGSAASQVAAMTASGLWSLLGSVNARFLALANPSYTTSYFSGTTFFSYDFDYFAS